MTRTLIAAITAAAPCSRVSSQGNRTPAGWPLTPAMPSATTQPARSRNERAPIC
jgi:hypothetical protein